MEGPEFKHQYCQKKPKKRKSEMQCCEILGRKAKERRGCWARGVLSPFSGISYANTGAYT
jgi:hypothetical protein